MTTAQWEITAVDGETYRFNVPASLDPVAELEKFIDGKSEWSSAWLPVLGNCYIRSDHIVSIRVCGDPPLASD